MKQPSKLTRTQKEVVANHGLRPNEWSLVEETEFYYKLINKETGLIKSVDKFRRKRQMIITDVNAMSIEDLEIFNSAMGFEYSINDGKIVKVEGKQNDQK